MKRKTLIVEDRTKRLKLFNGSYQWVGWEYIRKPKDIATSFWKRSILPNTWVKRTKVNQRSSKRTKSKVEITKPDRVTMEMVCNVAQIIEGRTQKKILKGNMSKDQTINTQRSQQT